MYAWAGTVLHADLTNGRIREEPLSEELGKKFLGGRGINASFLWNLTRSPDIDPLKPENVLIFGSGTLTCTTAPCSGKTTVTGKSPLTNLYFKSSMGGYWGAELKFAGYDNLVIHGASEQPVYIVINDDKVELRDASHLWGLDTRETDKAIKKELHDYDVKIASIGPAGERLVRIAAIINSVYTVAGRCGGGAVMGSKKLKAIAVRGTGQIEVADPESFDKAVSRARKPLNLTNDVINELHIYGTAGSEKKRRSRLYTLYNKTRAHLENVYPVSGQCLVEKGYLKRRLGCFGCLIGCHRYTSFEKGNKFVHSGGPESEAMVAFGHDTVVLDTEAVIEANSLCNLMGLDAISVGRAIAWAMESYEKGVLTKSDTDGLEFNFGNADAMIQVIPMIARREGKIGSLLAQGVKRAAETVGAESWKWGIFNSKGLEQSARDLRSTRSSELAYAVNPRGCDHLHSIGVSVSDPQKMAMDTRYSEDLFTISDSLGFCIFATTGGMAEDDIAEMFSAATGIDMSVEEILFTGRRILTLEKCFNVAQGADRKMDDLPWRMMRESVPNGPCRGLMNTSEELNRVLDDYYTLHEWDPKTSWPLEETLKKLDLMEVADYLKRVGKLP